MKRIVTFIWVLAVVSPLVVGEKKLAPTTQPDKEQVKEKQLPAPKTLDEAHGQLEKQFPKKELAKIDAMKTEDEMIEYHFGLGMGMRNGWGLWGGGPLAQNMNKLGFHHPDDMSGVILRTFWCKRHKKDFCLKERAVYYAAYWKAAAEPPETAKDPKDDSVVEWVRSLGFDDGKNPRQIHFGKSQKTGRWLVYEHDKGVYVPDAALLKRGMDNDPNFTPPAQNEKPPGK